MSSLILQEYLRTMKRLQTDKFELRTNGQQQRYMRHFADSCRFVFYRALALQKERYEQGEKKSGYTGMCRPLTEWRNRPQTAWVADAPVHPLQQTLQDLERAYANFLANQADFPRFRKKGQSDRFRHPNLKRTKLEQVNSRLSLTKLGGLRYRNSRDALSEMTNINVSRESGKWFVSIQTEQEVEQPVLRGGAVGIDFGLSRFATLIDCTYYAPFNRFKRLESALRQAQQTMSRKPKFSNNWKKEKARIQRIHARIGNARRDTLNKCSSTIKQNHAMVCIEDLQVINLSRSAAGTTEKSGQERSDQVPPEQVHPRSRLVRVPPPAGLQAGVERRASYRRATSQPDLYLSVLQPCIERPSQDSGQVRVRGVWFRGKRRSGWRDQRSKCGTRPVSLRSEQCDKAASSRNPPKRPRGGSMPRMGAVGIFGIHAGEDVKETVHPSPRHTRCLS